MTKSFRKLVSMCGRIHSRRGYVNEEDGIRQLRKFMYAWMVDSSEGEAETVLFNDETHNTAMVSHFGDPNIENLNAVAGNEIFHIEQDGAVVSMTGEQLDSICRQWVRYRGMRIINNPPVKGTV